MAGRGGKALAASLVLLAWACAKATDSDLGGGAYDPHAAGNGNASGGSSARGGTGGSSAASTGGSGAVANAGHAGSSTGGSSTGGSSTGGSSTGGQSASGGTGNATASGGTGNATGGSAGQLGQAGDDGVPPDVLAKAKVVLRYAAHNHTAMADAVEAYLYFENKTDDPLDLAHVTVRYWTTLDGTSHADPRCYYAAIIGSDNVHPVFVDVGTDSHIDVTFSAGQVPAHNTKFEQTEFQVKLDADGGKFDQTNDYSFNATLTDERNPQPNGKIAVYLAGKLVWGCERSGVCAGDEGGTGGQGGEGGQAGQGGEPASSGGSNAGQGQGGQVSAGQGGEPAVGQGGEPAVGQGGEPAVGQGGE